MSCPGNVQIRNSCEPVADEKQALGEFLKQREYRYVHISRRNFIVLCATDDGIRTIRRSGNTPVDEWNGTKKRRKKVGKKRQFFEEEKRMERRLNPVCKSDKALHRTFDKRSIFPESVARQLSPRSSAAAFAFFFLSLSLSFFVHPLRFAASTEWEQRNAERAERQLVASEKKKLIRWHERPTRKSERPFDAENRQRGTTTPPPPHNVPH